MQSKKMEKPYTAEEAKKMILRNGQSRMDQTRRRGYFFIREYIICQLSPKVCNKVTDQNFFEERLNSIFSNCNEKSGSRN